MDSHCHALRQQLKEKFRARLRKETGPGAAVAVAGGKDNAAPADNYGSFFGPSEIVFADRVIQETKSWLENPNFKRGRKFKNVGRKKSAEASKIGEEVLQKMDRWQKVQCLKECRDYSFLSSDCEIPVPGKKPNISPPPEKIQGVQAIKKNSQNRQGFSILSSDCEIPTPGKKPNINSRPPERIQGVQAIKKPSETSMKNSWPEKKDSQVSKDSKKPSEKKMKSLISKKPQRETPRSKADGRKRKLDQPQADQEEEEDTNAISIIREMFGYDPTKFCDDEEDAEMEATFDDIQKEERRSMRIAKKEDDQELKKILQERKKKPKL